MTQFYGPRQEISLKTSFDMDRAIIFLPGMSGGAHGARFLPIDRLAEEDGYASARISLWEGSDDVERLSYEQIFTQLDGLLSELSKLGFIDYLLIGKNFGGGVALAYEHELVSRKVLWAPAIGVGAGAGNWNEMKDSPFSEINDLLAVQLGTDQLAAQECPIGIIHGTADDVVPVSNSEQIIDAVEQGTLKTIVGAGHSFKDHEHEMELLTFTHELLQ